MPDCLKRFNAEWFHSHAYIPNIYAAITGFLIGVPIALVVLATFTGEREDKAALDRVNKMTQLAWQKLRDSALAFATDERIYNGLEHQTQSIVTIHDAVFSEYQRRIASAQEYQKSTKGYRTVTDAEILDFQKYLREQELVFRERMDAARDFIGWQHDLQTQWSIIRTNWNTLSGYVPPATLGAQPALVDDQLDAHISDDLAENQHPLTQFMRLHDAVPSGSRVSSMGEAIAHIQQDIYRPVEELRAKLAAAWPRKAEFQNEFGWNKVEGYHTAASNAHSALWGFKRAVDDVEKSGWPGNATQPTPLSCSPFAAAALPFCPS